MKRRTSHLVFVRILLVASILVASILASTTGVAQKGKNPCQKFSGWVNLTYTNPTTIILHVIKGKVNAATTFTMTPTTTYARNGQPATFADIKIGDTGYITATEQLPSWTLLACAVVVTGQ